VTDGTQTAFIWNGNRIIREMKTSPTLSVTYSYIWGAEGTPLAMTDSTNTFFYCLDANKNVTDLVDASGNSVAHYEYSPFGVTTLSIGSLAQTNPFRFSSEYADSTTDFIHYKYRIYLPQLARWLSHDPVEENGGVNLYVFVENSSVNFVDSLGLLSSLDTPEGVAVLEAIAADSARNAAGTAFVALTAEEIAKKIKTKSKTDEKTRPISEIEDPILRKRCEKLKEDQERVCGQSHSCKGDDDKATLMTKLAIGRLCRLKRITVMEVCYKGGNKTHKDHIIGNVDRAIAKCEKRLEELSKCTKQQ